MKRIRFDLQQRPVIRDTGILLQDLLDCLRAGQTETEIIEEHPALEHEDFEELHRWGKLLTNTSGVSERFKEMSLEAKAKLDALRRKKLQ